MPEKLTPQEEEALQAVFKTGEGNIKSILENMEDKLPYTTVASTIKNLEKKGYLQSRLLANTYLYKPAISEEEFKSIWSEINEIQKMIFKLRDKLLNNLAK